MMQSFDVDLLAPSLFCIILLSTAYYISYTPHTLFYILYTIYFTILYFTLRYDTLLYFTLLYDTLLYFTILYYTLLYYTLLYYTILYFTILYYVVRSLAQPLCHHSISEVLFLVKDHLLQGFWFRVFISSSQRQSLALGEPLDPESDEKLFGLINPMGV